MCRALESEESWAFFSVYTNPLSFRSLSFIHKNTFMLGALLRNIFSAATAAFFVVGNLVTLHIWNVIDAKFECGLLFSLNIRHIKIKIE